MADVGKFIKDLDELMSLSYGGQPTLKMSMELEYNGITVNRNTYQTTSFIGDSRNMYKYFFEDTIVKLGQLIVEMQKEMVERAKP